MKKIRLSYSKVDSIKEIQMQCNRNTMNKVSPCTDDFISKLLSQDEITKGSSYFLVFLDNCYENKGLYSVTLNIIPVHNHVSPGRFNFIISKGSYNLLQKAHKDRACLLEKNSGNYHLHIVI